MPDGQLIPVTDPEVLFKQLRNDTESRFFSNDTCFHPDLPGPKKPASENNNYFYDKKGRKIAHKGRSYRKSGNPRDSIIDPVIAQEQFAEIGPIAVRYVASLIKYYSSQTNAYPCPTSKGTLYAMSYNSGALYAYDGKSWKTSNIPIVTGLYDLRMAVYNDKLYVSGYNEASVGQVYVCNGTSCALSQTFGTYDEPTALIVHDSKLYIAMTNYYYHRGSIYLYDGVSWQASLAPNDVFLPLRLGTNNDTLYAGGWGGIFSLSAGTWRQSLIDVVPFAMTSYGGNLYVGTNYGSVYKYDGLSWTGSFSTRGYITSLAVYDGALYAGGSSYDSQADRNYGMIYRFDGSSWTISLSSPYGIYGLSVYGTRLYAGLNSIEIYSYDGSTWEKAFETRDGSLYIIGTY